MKIVKKILMIVLLLLVLLVGAAIAIPYFFKDDILVALRETINKNVDATVDFEDINLSLLRSFPDFSLGIASYKITGRDAFEGIVLAEGESIDLTLDIWSVISSDQPIQLKSINVDAPRIHVVVTRNGKANYDIFGTSADTSGDSETTDFVIQLDEYRISDAHLIYDDRTLPAYVDIKSMNHEGTGNFTQDIYDLATATQIAAFTARYDGITYLNKAETNLNATVNIDNSRSRYTLKDNELTINDLTVSAEGWLELAGDDILMDLEFGTPENDFRSLFSLVPSAYIADYEDVDIKGQFELSGMAKGTYSSAREQYPAFGLDMNVTDGDVQYPELPLGISDIYTAMEIQHPGGNLNKMKIDIDNFRLNVGSNPISGRFKLRTPLSDPDMDARIKGKLDLTSLQQAFPVTDVEALSGIVQADVTVDARMSAVDSGNYQDVEMAGTANVQDVNYKGMGMPLVQVNSLAVDFSPTKVTIDNFNTKLGASDLRGSGQIDNVLAFFAKDKTMSGKFDLVSNYFNADEWLTTSESENPVIVDNTVETSTTTDEPFDNFVFDFDVVMDKIDYDIYKVQNLAGEGTIASNTLTIDNFYTQINGSDIRANGTIDNILNFVYYNEGIGGNIDFSSDYLDLDALAGTTEEAAATTTTTTEVTTAAIPDIKYDLNLNGNAKRIKYDVYELQNVQLAGNLTEQQVRIDDFNATMGRSDMRFSGTVEDYMPYVFKNETVSGTLNMQSRFFDANEFLVEDPSAVASSEPVETAIIPVPANMKFDINANIDEVVYTNMQLRNLEGKIIVADEAVTMQEVSLQTLGGRINLAGSYDTKDIDNPTFDFKYDLADLKYKEVFKTVNTFAAATPIAEYLNGAFNSTLEMNGILGKDLLPQLNSISADGFLQTLQATLEGFLPFGQIAEQLGIDELKELKLRGTKNWFTIKDGRVDVQPFDVDVKDIAMNIAGSHGLDQSLDYIVKAKIPRAMLGSGTVGSAANKGLDLLSGQAARLGLNIANSAFVNVQIGVKGSIVKPKLDIKLLGGEGEASVVDAAKDEVKEQIDEVKEDVEQAAKDELEKQKQKAEERAQALRDSLEKVAAQKAEEALRKAEEEAAKKAEELKDKIGEEATDKAKEVIDDVIDEETKEKVKDKIKDLNPFKKKKKEGGN